MSAQWGSARQALAYLFSCRRGPRLSQPRYTNVPPSTGHHHLDHVLVGALLYGEDKLGIEPGSDLDDELQEWALDRDAEASDRVRDVVCELGRLLREHGLKTEVDIPDRGMFVRWTYPDGTSGLRMRPHVATLPPRPTGS